MHDSTKFPTQHTEEQSDEGVFSSEGGIGTVGSNVDWARVELATTDMRSQHSTN